MTYLVYSCRLCRRKFSIASQMDFGHGVFFYITRNQMTTTHNCSKVQLGVADLIGEKEAFTQEEFGS